MSFSYLMATDSRFSPFLPAGCRQQFRGL
jgi:hypothetical protein